jgi:hypothetical protein
MLKKLLVVGIFALCALLTLGAQDIEKLLQNEKLAAELSLKDSEIRELTKLWTEGERAIQIAAADRDVKASELRRLLLEENVDMNAVKKALRDGMESEFRIRLVQIERAMQARKLLGEKRWADLQRLLRNYAAKHNQGMADPLAPDPQANKKADNPRKGNQ